MKNIDGNNERNIHYFWDNSNRPIAKVNQNEVFTLSIPDSSIFQINRNSNREDLKRINWDKVDGAVGPVFVEGAKPGDALKIELLEVESGDWGWTAIFENFGVLSSEFKDDIVIWGINNGTARSLKDGFLEDVEIPVSPFLGIVGTAPKSGRHTMIPPQYFGGNMDNKLLKAGSILHLPVSVDGGLVSFADPHAAQGDGEVCGTAIETTASVKVRIEIESDMKLKFPYVESLDRPEGRIMSSMGIGPDMREAAKEAVAEMIRLLSDAGYSREEAYVLCSVAGNLRVSEMVDMPNYVVSMTMPFHLF